MCIDGTVMEMLVLARLDGPRSRIPVRTMHGCSGTYWTYTLHHPGYNKTALLDLLSGIRLIGARKFASRKSGNPPCTPGLYALHNTQQFQLFIPSRLLVIPSRPLYRSSASYVRWKNIPSVLHGVRYVWRRIEIPHTN